MAERTLEEEYREYLDSLPIQTLRTLGRKIGIPPESRKSKPGCLHAIIDLLMGRADPVPDSGKGAPVKQDYLDPSIIRHLEDLRLAQERKKGDRPLNTFTVHSPEQPKSIFDQPVYTGLLEILPGGYGFLRTRKGQPTSGGDIFIAAPLIHSLSLREGDLVACTAKPPENGEPSAMQELLSVNGIPFGEYEKRPKFDTLTPCYPTERIPLSSASGELSLRMIDLFSPIGRGQRAIIVSPPDAGRLALLKELAIACARMRPELHLILLLLDERPEDVTELRRAAPDAEFLSSTFDEEAARHVRLAELAVAHAKRLAESGRHVVVLVDSLTRLLRAYQLTSESPVKSSSMPDPGALTALKRLFGAARNTEEAGSITILATVPVEPGSRTDGVLCEELSEAGNCKIVLTRRGNGRENACAIDPQHSATRREELLLSPEELSLVRSIREKGWAQMQEDFLKLMKKTKNNAEFLAKSGELTAAKRKKEIK